MRTDLAVSTPTPTSDMAARILLSAPGISLKVVSQPLLPAEGRGRAAAAASLSLPPPAVLARCFMSFFDCFCLPLVSALGGSSAGGSHPRADACDRLAGPAVGPAAICCSGCCWG